MTVYLTVDQIVAINAEYGDGVDDWAGLEACVYRPKSGGFGVEGFPDVWSKAAAYLHGIASTQYFSDGNKRTAWDAAVTFLRLNGCELPDVETIDAENFVQSIAQNVFNTAEEPDLTVQKAADWFRIKWDTQRVGPCRDRRLELMFVCEGIAPGLGPSLVNLGHAFIRGKGLQEFALPVTFFVVVMIHWDEADIGREHLLTAFLVDAESGEHVGDGAAVNALAKFQAAPLEHHDLKTCGIAPALLILPMRPLVRHPGLYNVVLDIDGKTAATLSLNFFDLKEMVATDEGLSSLVGGPNG